MEFYMTSACLIIKTLIWYEKRKKITKPATTHILGEKTEPKQKKYFIACGGLFFFLSPLKATDHFLPVVFCIWIGINIFAYLLRGKIPDYMPVTYITLTRLVCYGKNQLVECQELLFVALKSGLSFVQDGRVCRPLAPIGNSVFSKWLEVSGFSRL